MPAYKREYDYSAEIHEQIIDDIDGTIEKTCVERVLRIFMTQAF